MERIVLDIRDWGERTHLGDAVWERYLTGLLGSSEQNAAERHLLACPCCQEQLLAIKARRADGFWYAAA